MWSAGIRGASWLLATLLGWGTALAGPVDPCDLSPDTNRGCEFYAVSLPNPLMDQGTFPFGVQILNLRDMPTDVTISGGALAMPIMATLPANANQAFELPWVSALSTSVDTVVVAGGAYRIVTTGPVVATQLNPMVAVGTLNADSTDGSLLRPVQGADDDYVTAAWPTFRIIEPILPGYLAVVATSGGTTVQITAPSSLHPGAGLTSTGGMVGLNAGDVLLLSSARTDPGGAGSDLSGTQIIGTAPVLVWSGHAATSIPQLGIAADHVEDMLPPASQLESRHLVARPLAPSGSDTDSRHFVKIVAREDNTSLFSDPVIMGLPGALGANQVATVEATVDFELISTRPVLVAQFMQSADQFPSVDTGDPALSISVPSRRGQRVIDFLTPNQQLEPSRVQLIAETGAEVRVDGVLATGWATIGNSGFSVTHMAVAGGVDTHQAIGDSPFLLSVIAYGTTMSYWYPGGMDLLPDLFADSFESPMP